MITVDSRGAVPVTLFVPSWFGWIAPVEFFGSLGIFTAYSVEVLPFLLACTVSGVSCPTEAGIFNLSNSSSILSILHYLKVWTLLYVLCHLGLNDLQ